MDVSQNFSVMYWGDSGLPGIEPKVAMVNMDGSSPRLLLFRGVNLRMPSHLALDTKNGILYISDTFNYKVC